MKESKEIWRVVLSEPGWEDICIDSDFKPTDWAYCSLPEPPIKS